MQTVHDINMPVALAGMTADAGIVEDVVSGLCEESTGIDAGLFLKFGTDTAGPPPQVKLPTAGTMTPLLCAGVSCYDASKMPVTTGSAVGKSFDNKEMINVCRKGRRWVLVDAVTITPNTAVFVRTAAGNLGKARHDADGGNAEQIEGCVFRSARKTVALQNGLTQDIALVEINLPATA
jgi:hypothetical protein